MIMSAKAAGETKGITMNKQLPKYCSSLCANEAREAGVLEGDWIDTESEEYLDSLEDDSEEHCDWC